MNSNRLAPVILFVYNRPAHTEKTLRALKRNYLSNQSMLFVFSDGPKENATTTDIKKIEEVRRIVKKEKWCGEVSLIERDKNMGLAASIIKGVTETLTSYDRLIVLEDDITTKRSFLTYMNSALDYYSENARIASIQAFSFPIKGLPEYYFLRGADCWGWGTWKRAWDCFEPDGKKLLDGIISHKLEHEFNYYDTFGYVSMLKEQIEGKVDSWAIRWQASTFLMNMISLYPGKNFVENIGFDGSGVHTGNMNIYRSRKKNVHGTDKFDFSSLVVEENFLIKKKIAEWFKDIFNPGPLKQKMIRATSLVKLILYKVRSGVSNLKYK